KARHLAARQTDRDGIGKAPGQQRGKRGARRRRGAGAGRPAAPQRRRLSPCHAMILEQNSPNWMPAVTLRKVGSRGRFIRHPGEGRDPPVKRWCVGTVATGLRYDKRGVARRNVPITLLERRRSEDLPAMALEYVCQLAFTHLGEGALRAVLLLKQSARLRRRIEKQHSPGFRAGALP